MRRGYLLSFFLLILAINGSPAQNTSPAWTGMFQGTGDNSDRFNKIVHDGAGNFVGVGYTVRSGNHRDILTVKFDANGDTIWWRTKNGKENGDDEGNCIGVDASGNIYVAGYVDDGNTQNDIMIIKYDASGTIQWDTTWDSPASLDDEPVAMKIDANGNCIIGGNAEPDTVTGSSDYVTVKFAPDGSVAWAAQYSRSGVNGGKDELASLTLDNNNDVYVTGRSFNAGNDDFVTIKYDGNSGAQLWLQTYNGGFDDRATAIVTDNAGNVIITGRSSNNNDFDFRTIKYDNAGLLQWTRLYNAPVSEDDRPNCLAVDAADNVIVAGISDVDGSGTTNFDFQVVKYNSAGTLQWAARTGNVVMQDDEPSDLAVDASGNIFVTGKTDMNPGAGIADYDFMTVMYNAAGVIQWSGLPVYHNGSQLQGDDAALSLIIENGNLFVAGGTVNNVTKKDAAVVKYDIASGSMVWTRDHNGEGDFSESARSIVIDANNISYAAGYTFSDGQNLNGCIAKFDQGGNLLCTYQYNGIKNDDDEFEAIAISSNGSIYTCGYTKVTGQKSNLLLVKWDPNTCDTLWTRNYDFANQSDRAEGLALDALGNIYVTGRSDANPVDTSDNFDIVTLKFDGNGNMLWTQRFDGQAGLRDEPKKIILTNSGEVLVGGRSENVHDDDFIVIKYNSSNGAMVWSNPILYNGPFANDDRVTDLIVDGSDNIFTAGYSQTSSAPALQDPVILKYDPAGNQTGFYSYNGEGQQEEPVKIATDINNNIYALIKYDTQPGLSSDSYNFLLKKFDNSLTDLWGLSSPQYNSPVNGSDDPADLKISPTGDIYVTGATANDTSGGRVNKNWVTLGYNDQGNLIFTSNFEGPNATDDSPNALIIRGSVMWVCGNVEGTGNSQKDLTVNNYNLHVGLSETDKSVNAVVYPNPFQNACTISLPGDKEVTGTLEVFNIMGALAMEPQKISGKEIKLTNPGLSPGLYEFRISLSDNSTAHGKLSVY